MNVVKRVVDTLVFYIDAFIIDYFVNEEVEPSKRSGLSPH